MADVFISYSRVDSVFVHALDEYLKSQERDVWVDWEDIAPASEWQQDIYDNIDAAESFVFVVSTRSLASEYCGKEFERAQKGGKRIVPIACDAADPAAAHPALGQLNWIWCRDSDDRDAAYEKLTNALDTDLAWAKAHTRLLVRAVEWETRGEDGSLLLRGRDLTEGEQQLAANAAKQPTPTELQQRYVHASRRGASRRQRFLLGGVSLALAVSIALGIVAVLQRNTANERARIARSQTFAAEATQALATAPVTALADGVKAVETSGTPEAEVALRRAILANTIDYAIPGASRGTRSGAPLPPQAEPNEGLAFSREGKLLLGLTSGSKLAVWRSSDGRRVTTIAKASHALFGRGDRILSTDGRTIRFGRAGQPPTVTRVVPSGGHAVAVGFAGSAPVALVAGHRAAKVVKVMSGSAIALRAPTVTVAAGVFSDHGRRVLTQNTDLSQVRVWNAVTGRLIATIPDDCLAAGCAVLSANGRFAATNTGLWSVDRHQRLAVLDASKVVFSPDGHLLVAVQGDGEATVYRSSDGTVIAEFPGFGSLFHPGVNIFTPFNPAAAFSTDDQHLAIANSDGSVRIWELASTEQVAAVHAGWVNELAFAPFGNRLAAMTWNGDVVVAAAPASRALRTHQGPASPEHWNVTPVVSADGRQIMAPVNWAAGAGEVGVWSVDGRRARILRPPAQGLPGVITAEAFSGDGSVVAAETSGPGGIASVNERFGTIVAQVRGRAAPLRLWATGLPLELDRRGSLVLIGRDLWETASGTMLSPLHGILALGQNGRLALVTRAGISSIVRVPSGRVVAELHDAGSLAGWASNSLDGKAAVFSPDDRRVLTQSSADDLRLWDTSSGTLLARLGRPGESVNSIAFTEGGRSVLVLFDDRVATFRASTGAQVATRRSSGPAISSDGSFAAIPNDDGSIGIVDLMTRSSVNLATDTARPLVTVQFGPTDGLLVASDDRGDVHVVRCAICAADRDLLQRAHAALGRLSRFRPLVPPVATD